MTASLNNWFSSKVESLKFDEFTKSYITNVFYKYSFMNDFDDSSLILRYFNANFEFSKYQKIGDWVLWASTFCPQHILTNEKCYMMFGKMSYDMCHKLLKKQWKLYEFLADQLPEVISETRKLFDSEIKTDIVLMS